jgi:hypothetical protein
MLYASLPGITSPAAIVQEWIRRMWAFNKLLTLTALLYTILIPVYIVAAILDPQLITNVPAFVKPLKFIISTAVYTATFVWLLTLVDGHKRWVQIAANVTALGILIENAIITMQAIRGIPSHFNMTTPLNQALYSSMGLIIMVVATMNLLLGIWLLFQRLPDPVIAWSIRLGVLISFVGMMIGVLMTTRPSAGQLALMQAGQQPSAVGAHSVGVEDSGPGLPLVGWSTEGGDLRVPHFVGLHAMQLLPLLGWALSRRRRLNQRQRMVLILSAGAAYLAWIALLTWQALHGQSIIAPDLLTIISYAGLIGFIVVALLVSLTTLHRPIEATARA